jgi:large subunit ribosomal protein L10e
MALRKASSYSKRHVTPYTRHSRRKGKAYIKTIPFAKIAKYNLGDQKAYREGKHGFIIRLVAEQNVLIRDTALEAGRMQLHKLLEESIPGEYFIMVKVHPHHFLRNNKTSGVAGADRMSTGMSHSFGIIEGRAAIVPGGKEIIFVSCTTEKAARVVRDSLEGIKAKMPGSTKIVFEPFKK